MLCIHCYFFVCICDLIYFLVCFVCSVSCVPYICHAFVCDVLCVMFVLHCVCPCVRPCPKASRTFGWISQNQLLSRQDSFENLLSKETKRNQKQISHLIRNRPSPACKLKRYLPVFWGFGGRVALLGQMINCQDWSPWQAGSEVPSAAVSHAAVFCSHTWQVDAFNKRPTFYLSSDVGIKAVSWPRLPSLCSWSLREGPQLLWCSHSGALGADATWGVGVWQ